MPNHLSDEATFRHGGEGKQMWKRTRREDLERFHAGNLWVSRSFFLPAFLCDRCDLLRPSNGPLWLQYPSSGLYHIQPGVGSYGYSGSVLSAFVKSWEAV